MPLSFEKKVAFEHAKEEIRSRINIADIIGRHVALKPAGQNLKGLCPFHKEKTPSFTVTPAKGIFYCFGCHKGGDVFTFLTEFEGMSFSEALHALADEAGVKLDMQKNNRDSLQASEQNAPQEGFQNILPKNELLKINQVAVDFYYSQTRLHKHAIEYFLGRGLTREIIKEFKLGYAPAGWSELLSHAKKNDIPESSLIQCGLAIERQNGGAYDRFRDRIMFPIFDTSKRPIGFGGRGMTPDAQPKYLNSPETFLYQKNKTLYGLHAAQYHIKESKSVIIVEGYMDFLSLYQAGIKNVVATSGTALGDNQARIIQRFTSTIYLGTAQASMPPCVPFLFLRPIISTCGSLFFPMRKTPIPMSRNTAKRVLYHLWRTRGLFRDLSLKKRWPTKETPPRKENQRCWIFWPRWPRQ